MSNVLSDQPARDLISSTGLDQTLFVEAGAGTGKTTQLVDRIVRTVLEREVPLSEIAAITFTEAAASELQARIRVQFERAADTDDPVVRSRAMQAIADADLAAISTVHGFASRILGEFAVAAGLPPRVSVLDEVASQLAHEERWGRFVDMLDAEPSYDELLYRAALIDVPLTPRFAGQASFKDVAANFAQNWDRLGELIDETPAPLGPIDFGPFDRAVATLAAAPADCTDTTDLLYAHLQAVLPEMQAAVAVADPHRKLRRLQALYRAGAYRRGASRAAWGRGKGGAKGKWSTDVKEVKGLIDEVNDALAAVLDQVSHDVLDRLMRLVAREVHHAAQERRSNGGLEFHDLLVLARQVLRDNAEVRRALHARYRHVLLDEFQDTDPIQIELASLIAATPADEQPARWQEHAVDGGRLFFVGDPKQSIYRFRRADIELFLEARDAYGEAGNGAVRLDTNFRTVPPIIDWVNGLFSDAMAEEVPGAQPKYEPLHAGRSFDSDADHRPVVLGGEHPDPKVKAGELRTTEAADVAGIVAHIESSPGDWPVFDEHDRTWRPARLSDVTILIPTRTSLTYLREALDERSLPYRLATGTLVYDTQEVRDALAVLRAIDDPNDTLSLIAALRSPLYGCSDVDLYEYHQAHRRWSLRNDTPDQLGDDHPVVSALAHLRTLWEQRWWITPANMLERVLRERHGFLLGYGTRRPAEVWRRLRFLVDQARSFEESNGGGLRSFLDWAALQSSDGSRVHEPMLPETDDDAVQIITIHGSKGLEFPITILSGMTTAAAGRRNGVSVLWGASGPPEVKLRAGVATAEHSTRADIEEEMDDHEKLRLLYVAATRARDHLIVSGHHKASNNEQASFATRMAMFGATHPELCRTVDLTGLDGAGRQRDEPGDRTASTETTSPTGATTTSDAAAGSAAGADPTAALTERQRWIDERAALVAPFDRPRTLSATAIARSVDATVADTDDDTVEPSPGEGPAVVRKKGRAGSAIGSAVHATLEFVDFHTRAELAALTTRQCELHAIPDAIDVVLALVTSALDSDAVELARAHRSYRELYVAAPLGDVMVEGYIDLLVETPDGLVIVDYKSDSASSPREIDEKLAAYELQGAAYAVALEASTGLDVAECRFVFCKSNGAIERSVDDLAGAKQRVRDAVAAGIDPSRPAPTASSEPMSPAVEPASIDEVPPPTDADAPPLDEPGQASLFDI
ncbi:UvrD-helicase domain-containing protein [Ilumatobacter coccineus]|uniref:DNA 3'-5' helicase n=1 Tax=Ilumatobacter coccineus (strain NBRC 103263 / KCTC 29153 / YM16-304) TaxID=1313172 RepID=A0A6C7EDZ1_ILUCY|nr:UvrD-helicase domain-containing protein [Ilumatobacter coccineus]BAN02196.1 putative ATP-dependent DNA helicase [Ilumatobacter coccineus YM16-304]